MYTNQTDMNTDNTTQYFKTKLIEALADYLSATGGVSQQTVLELGVSIYKNEEINKDLRLLQSVRLIDFLNNQIKSGNEDIITKDIVDEIFTYILQKLTTGIIHKNL